METQDPNSTNPKKKEQIIIAVLGVLLLGSLAYNLYQFNENKVQTENFEIDLKDTESAKNKLQDQLDSLSDEFEKTRTEIEVRDSILSKRDAEIFDKQREIQNILNQGEISESELRQAKRMIVALNADIARFKQEINDLQVKNDSLLAVNENLNIEKTSISEELSSEKEKAIETEQNIRSTFSVSNYKITGLQVRNSGKEVETDKARKIDKLRVSFDLDPNEWAETGEKEIYVAIFKPGGSLGKFKDASSGELETWSLGTIQYSDKIKFNYTTGTKKNISFDWEDYEFPKGNYKIDIYQNGFKIGQKSLELK